MMPLDTWRLSLDLAEGWAAAAKRRLPVPKRRGPGNVKSSTAVRQSSAAAIGAVHQPSVARCGVMCELIW